MKNVLTVTLNPALDKSCEIDSVTPDTKMRTDTVIYHPGGGGINVSRAINKLGGSSRALLTVGGHTGELLQELLNREEIDFIPITVPEPVRENLTVFEKSTNRQFRFVMPGAVLEKVEYRQCLHVLAEMAAKPDILVLSGSLPVGVPEDFYAEMAAWGVREHVQVVADTGGEALKHVLGAGVYLIKPNLRELRQLFGEALESDKEITRAARKLVQDNKAEIVVVSLGAGGARVVTAEQAYHIATPTVKIKSKVGAGDSMVAGLVLSLAQGKELLEAVKYGVAAGAAAVMSPGTELCNKDNTDKLYFQME